MWCRFKDKAWATDDPVVARRLDKYATIKALDALEGSTSGKSNTNTPSKNNFAVSETLSVPKGLDYMPFQKEGIRYALQRKGTLIADQMGLGKLEPNSAMIPMFNRTFKRMGDIKIGDYVIGKSGVGVKVTGVFPQGVQEMYRLNFWDGASVICGAEHLWCVTDSNGGRRKELYGTEWTVKTTAELMKSKSAFKMPLVKPVCYEEKDYPIDPYTMGIIIAEGYTGAKATSLTVSIGDLDTDIINYLPKNVSISQAVGCTRVHLKGLITKIKKIDGFPALSKSKRIPEEYMLGSISQRKELLRGLMDGDGTIRNNRVSYSTIAPQLAKDVKRLVASLGGIGKIRSYDRTHQDKGTDYSVNIKTTFCPFKCKRKSDKWHRPDYAHEAKRSLISIDKLGYKEESTCISVEADDCLYLTGYDYVVTHNTVQAIGFINNKPINGKILVVCPATLKINWFNELKKWLVVKRPIHIMGNRGLDMLSDINIINYASLVKHKKDLLSYPFELLIADESHYIKNNKAQRTKAFMAIAKKIPYKLYLTGTPILNRPIEMQTMLKSLGFEIAQDRWKYAERYCDLKRNDFGWDLTGHSNLKELKGLLHNRLMIRRLKENVLKDLPPKTRQVISLEPDGFNEGIKRHSSVIDNLLASGSNFDVAIRNLFSSGVKSIADISKIRKEAALKKIPLAIQHITNVIENTGKIIVFAHHRDVIDELTLKLRTKYKGVVVTGATPQNDRQNLVNIFQTDSECKFFIGSIAAAGVGLNLTAANILVFLEFDWSPGMMEQVEDRCHRISQTNKVLIQYIVFNGSIDSYMLNMILDKKKVIDKTLNL